MRKITAIGLTAALSMGCSVRGSEREPSYASNQQELVAEFVAETYPAARGDQWFNRYVAAAIAVGAYCSPAYEVESYDEFDEAFHSETTHEAATLYNEIYIAASEYAEANSTVCASNDKGYSTDNPVYGLLEELGLLRVFY